jgi:pyridoxal 5'-phosphate synthase pdxS subunit
MALERVPADIRAQGGVARMSDPKMIREIMAAVTIPVMAKARIGHFVECQACIPDMILCILRGPQLTVQHRFSRPLGWIILTSQKYSPLPIMHIMSRSILSRFHLFVDAAIWVKLFVV